MNSQMLLHALRLLLITTTGLFLAGFREAHACPLEHCVRVGSWNIEWFGSELREQPSDPKTIEAMVALISDELSMDLVVLQEINTQMDQAYRGKNHSLKFWRQLQQQLASAGYQSASGTSGLAQQVVLVWKSSTVQSLRKPAELPVNDEFELHEYCRSANLRKPLAGQFRSGLFDFWVVGVHLKAAGANTQCSNDIRQQQVVELLDHLKPLQALDPDIILAGDFNGSMEHDSLKALHAAHYMPLHHKKIRAIDSHHTSHHSNWKKPQRGRLIDHMFVSTKHTKEWLANSAQIYRPDDLGFFIRTYSDHLPLWVDFSTVADDD